MCPSGSASPTIDHLRRPNAAAESGILTSMDMTPEIKKARWEVLWGAQRSQRYHSRRSMFFDRWNKATAFVGVIGGSSVVASLGKLFPPDVGLFAAAIVTVMSGIDLVAGTAEMARKHNDLRKRFCELESKMLGELSPSDDSIAKWRAERLAIESDEPPIYVALDLLCYNELARSYGHMQDVPPQKLGWFKTITAQLLPWPNA